MDSVAEMQLPPPHPSRRSAVPPSLKGEAFLRTPFIKIPQKSHPILATAGNLWYACCTIPRKGKSVYTLFFCTKYTEDGFLTNHIKGEKYDEKTDFSLSAGAGHARRIAPGHRAGRGCDGYDKCKIDRSCFQRCAWRFGDHLSW
ncbi:MAG: hypothetical protein U0N04_08570 [Oscillospiraceae bacterium]